MDKTNYQEVATNHAKEHLDMLLRMETTLGRRKSQVGKDRNVNEIQGDNG